MVMGLTVTHVAVMVIVALLVVAGLAVLWGMMAMSGQLDDADGTRG